MEFVFLKDLPISDPVLIFALVMSIILVVPLVSDKLRVPAIVGLIFAGAITGPGALGLLDRDNTIILLGTVGLLYIMFTAGISMDLEKFIRFRTKSIIFGVISFGLPMAGSLLLAPSLLGYSLQSALLLGAIVGSHTLLAYPIANRLGIGSNTAVTMSLGATMVTDALSLTLLAIVAAMVQGEAGPGFWVTFFSLVTLYVVVVVFTLPRLGKWFFRNVKDRTNLEYVFLLTVLFITAYMAQLVGLAAIIGAFLAGIGLNRLVPESGALMNRIHFVGNALFIPFFLISVGMLVDFRTLVALDVWLVSALFLLLVVAGKFLAAAIARLLFGLTSEEGWVMFGLTTPQAAATLAVTLIGYDLGLFSELAVNAVVILIMSSCFIGPYVVDLYGRRIVLKQEKEEFKVSEAPERILVPLSNPETAESLMDIAIMIRGNNSEEAVFPLTVARESGQVEAAVASGEKLLSHAVVHAAAADIPVIPVTRVDLNIASGIVRATRELRISDIVIGWNGVITARQRVFGSVLDQLLDQSDETILVSKIDEPLNTTERVILAIPPMSQYESGFGNTLQSVKKLVYELGAKVMVVATESNLTLLKPFLEKEEPKIKAEYKAIESWSRIARFLRDNYRVMDLVILVSSRRGSVAWRPGFERLPRQIIQMFNPDNLIIVYPAQVEEHYRPTAVLSFDDMPLLPDLSSNHILIGGNGELHYHKAIEKLVEALFPEQREVATEVMQQLKGIDPDRLADDIPGVLLMQHRTTRVEQPILLMGINEEGFGLNRADRPVTLLFLLLTPPDTNVQRNLLILSQLSRLVQSPQTRDELSKVKDIEQIKEILPARLSVIQNTQNSDS